MDDDTTRETSEAAWACVSEINGAWLSGFTERLAELFAPDVVMALPGFAGRVAGAAALIASFDDFSRSARVHRFDVVDRQVDVVRDSAVVSFAFDMDYERGGARYRSSGRDLWVLERSAEGWRALWRTMLELSELPVEDVAGDL
jgi:ketosteroid isomerase-like protein